MKKTSPIESKDAVELTAGEAPPQNTKGSADDGMDASASEVAAEAAPDDDAGDREGVQLDPVEALRREVAEWKDKFLRAKAEQQNAVRRATQQMQESVRYANAGLLRRLLEVADDFERSLDAARSVAGDPGAAGEASTVESVRAVLDGVVLVQQKLEKLLQDEGTMRFEAMGEPFNPERHEALMQQPTADHAAGTVIQQIQAGYTYHDRVLRPAKVIIATDPPESDAQTNADAAG